MSGLQNILIELESRTDKFNQTYYMGRFRAPTTIKFKHGVAFLIYVSERDMEEMRIACAKPGSEMGGIKRRFKPNTDAVIDKYVIRLEKRLDQNDKIYYLGLVQDDVLELDMGQEGFVFFVFTAKDGQEELHIGKNDFVAREPREESSQQNRRLSSPQTEIVHRNTNDPYKGSDSGDYYATPQLPRRAVG